jgi:hypothetical protein
MKKYKLLEFDRKSILQYFAGGSGLPLRQDSFSLFDSSSNELIEGAFFLLWESDGSMPVALVTDRASLLSVLPRLMSLPGAPAPFTSICRAWTTEQLRVAERRVPRGESNRIEAFVALIIGELQVRVGQKLDISSVGSSVARRTISHMFANLYLVGASEYEFVEAVDSWHRAAEKTGNVVSQSLVEALSWLTSFLQAIPDDLALDSLDLGRRIKDYLAAWGAEEAQLHSMNRLLTIAASLKGSAREKRYEDVMAVVENFVGYVKGPRPAFSSMVAGYALSLIEPGSLDFLPMAHKMEEIYPGAVCAYAMSVALISGKDFLRRDGSFGVHLVNSSLAANQIPDISIAELDLLSLGREGDFGFRTSSPSLLNVEFLPYVYATFQVRHRRGDQSTSDTNAEVAQRDGSQRLAELEEIANIEVQLAQIYDSVSRLRSSLDENRKLSTKRTSRRR